MNAETLRDLLTQQVQLLNKLDAVLGDEHALLERKQLDRLSEITDMKSRLLDELRHLELTQYELLKAESANPSVQIPSLKRLLAELPQYSDTSVQALFDKLGILANKCRDQNTINGMLIHSRRKINLQILSAFKGKAADAAATTYGRNGVASAIPFSGTNVKA